MSPIRKGGVWLGFDEVGLLFSQAHWCLVEFTRLQASWSYAQVYVSEFIVVATCNYLDVALFAFKGCEVKAFFALGEGNPLGDVARECCD